MMFKLVFACVLLLDTVLSAQRAAFKAPDSCATAGGAGELESCGNYYYMASRYAEALPYYERLEAMQHKPQILMRIYFAATSVGRPFDKNRILNLSSAEELLYYAKSLNGNGDWDFAAEVCARAVQIAPTVDAKTLWHNICHMGGIPFDLQVFTKSESARDLVQFGEYFLNAMRNDTLAKQLFLRSEKIQHSSGALTGLYKVAQRQNKPFDTDLFLRQDDPSELALYAGFMQLEAYKHEKHRDKVPELQIAVQCIEKANKGKQKVRFIAEYYNNLSFFQLFVPDGKAAEMSARKALKVNPDYLLAYTNLAPALLLQGKYKAAEKEYRKWKDKPLQTGSPVGGELLIESLSEDTEETPKASPQTFRAAFLSDLDELERNGITHPDFAKIRMLLKEN